MRTVIPTFDQILESAAHLPLEDQALVAEVLHRRVIEQRRRELAREVREAQAEYKAGKCEPVSAKALMSEILDWNCWRPTLPTPRQRRCAAVLAESAPRGAPAPLLSAGDSSPLFDSRLGRAIPERW